RNWSSTDELLDQPNDRRSSGIPRRELRCRATRENDDQLDTCPHRTLHSDSRGSRSARDRRRNSPTRTSRPGDQPGTAYKGTRALRRVLCSLSWLCRIRRRRRGSARLSGAAIVSFCSATSASTGPHRRSDYERIWCDVSVRRSDTAAGPVGHRELRESLTAQPIVSDRSPSGRSAQPGGAMNRGAAALLVAAYVIFLGLTLAFGLLWRTEELLEAWLLA